MIRLSLYVLCCPFTLRIMMLRYFFSEGINGKRKVQAFAGLYFEDGLGRESWLHMSWVKVE